MLRFQLDSMTKISWLFTCLVSIDAKIRILGEVFSSPPGINTESGRSPELQVTVWSDPYGVRGGDAFFAFCYNLKDQAEIWWTRDERNLTSAEINHELKSNPRYLSIASASRKHTGNYTCVARTSTGDVFEETITVRVVVPGSTIPVQRQVRVKNNEPATLSCNVQGYPISKFIWNYESEHNPVQVVENNSETAIGISYTSDSHVVMTLHFERVTVSQHGYYRCIAHDYKRPIFHEILLSNISASSVHINQYKLLIAMTPVIRANSIYISWQMTLEKPTDGRNEYYILFEYMKNGTEKWKSQTPKIGRTYEERYVEGLDNSTAYQFRIQPVNYFGNPLGPAAYSEWITTMEEDHEFSPILSIEATTLHSITIRPSMPAELENWGVGSYEVKVTRGNETIRENGWNDVRQSHVIQNLESMTRYQIRVAACVTFNTECGKWSAEREVVTLDRDPVFVPNISVTKTTRDSITIGWTGPGPELRDRVYQYKVIATNEDDTRDPIYLPKTANSYVFQNLTPETFYKLKVAACSEYETQCADWSEEQTGLTVDKVEEGQENTVEPSVIATVIILVVIVIGLIIWLVIRNRREKTARRRFIEATLQRFNLGALDSLNPELNIGDQAELLPYKKKWEFPRELLTLDRILGSGAFGVVRKAQAKSICRPEIVTTVAVKLVRASARLHHLTALTRELKILAYLGKNLNVVNLLGACTQNVSYGELFVIVEFCRFGNLRDYLLHRRTDFINQIDTTAPSRNIDSSSSFSVDPVNPNGEGVAASSCSNGSETEDSRQNTEPTITSVTVGHPASESNSDEFGPPSKYQGDYMDDNLEPISTRDLVCWSWQISRGMEYLGSRRILHGDLAARNVLLADRNVVKICDFGLSKSLFTDDNYTKKGHGPLPVRWMAIESLRDRVFSIQSDIWSYGIVLWELFTLSETPYHGINNENIYQNLADGFRLAKPKYATEEIYHAMLRCWDAEPKERPSFAQLENLLVELLDETVKTYYVDLSAPYAQMNADDLEHGEIDYLTMGPSGNTSNATEQVQETNF